MFLQWNNWLYMDLSIQIVIHIPKYSLEKKKICWLRMSLAVINTVIVAKILLPSLTVIPYLQNNILNLLLNGFYYLPRWHFPTYVCVCVCVCIYIYIYIYIHSSINFWLHHTVLLNILCPVPIKIDNVGTHTVVRRTDTLCRNECWLYHLMSVKSE